MSTEQLEALALEVIAKLTTTIEQQKATVRLYEGGIEGIKLFMQELKARGVPAEVDGGQDNSTNT